MDEIPPRKNGFKSIMIRLILVSELAGSHKDDGNQWFKKKKYKLAIKAYDEGLKLKFDDGNLRAVLYTNRAAANFHLGE